MAGLSKKLNDMFPSRCQRVNGICPTKAFVNDCPKRSGPTVRPVVMSKNKVPIIAKYTKFNRVGFFFLKKEKAKNPSKP